MTPTPTPTPLDFAVDSLAVHRATRLITTDTVTAPVRAAIDAKFPPDRLNLRYAIHCDFCSSIYVAAAVTATHAPPLRFLRPLVYLLAAADLTAIIADQKEQQARPTGWS